MAVGLMAAEGHGEREKGHRWTEALSSVEVPKVNEVSVKLTLMFPLLQIQRNSYVTGCLWRAWLWGLAVYLFEHIGCIVYIVMSQSVLDMRSSYKVPTGSCPSMTVVFEVWYVVRL